MKYCYLTFLIFFTLAHPRAGAQETAVVADVDSMAARYLSAAKSFTDGVYASHRSLVAEQPDYRWSQIAGEMVQLEEDGRVQIEAYGDKENGGSLPSPYAIALDGRLYFYVPNPTDARRGFLEFTAPVELGTLSVIGYDTTFQVRQLMRAYNPRNGQPFRQGYVERERTRRVEYVIDMATGRRRPLDRPNVRELTAEDRDLAAALARPDNGERGKLLRAVRIFNERYPLALPVVVDN